MWICIYSESFLRRRLCVVLGMALAVFTLTEAPRAKAQDIVTGVNQARNLELYYAAVATAIPAAVTSVLTDQFEFTSEVQVKRREKTDIIGKKRPKLPTHLDRATTKAKIASDVNMLTEVNVTDNLVRAERKVNVDHKNENTRNAEATHKINDERITSKLKGHTKSIDVVQQDAKHFVTQQVQRTSPLKFKTNSLSGDPSIINAVNYSMNDYFEEGGDDDEEKEEPHVLDRVRKDISVEEITLQSLQRLAEFATASNPDLSLINLITPNPDIEITIEVLSGIGAEEYDGLLLTSSSDSTNEIMHTKPPGRKRKGKKRKGRRKKPTHDRDMTNNKNGNTNSQGKGKRPITNIPRRQSTGSQEEENNQHVGNGEKSSYSYQFGGPLLPLIPDDFENFNFPEDTFLMEEAGEWTDWSRCTATCGGGRTERSRSCGFSCTSTETQDCNQHPCPEIEYLDSQVIAGLQPAAETSSPTTETTDQLFGYLDPSLTDFAIDSCDEWMSCRSEKLMSYISRLEDLPSCPCFYPTNLHVNDMIWDKLHKQMFRWMVSDNERESLAVYKPTAKYCIRSLLTADSTSLAAQECCYDETMTFISRGPGAGTPKLISREISPELNFKIDILPWIICKGDWSKYNIIRQPNNARGCREFPGVETYLAYLEELKDF